MKTKLQKTIDEIIRVNHAGEYGAQRIYSGQIKFCKKKELKKKLETMIAEEFEHYDYFNKTMLKKRTRPTALSPIWHHGGYFLGAVTSVLGEKYVHACTEAVEEVIVDHYNTQIKYLESLGVEKEMLKKIKNFCVNIAQKVLKLKNLLLIMLYQNLKVEKLLGTMLLHLAGFVIL